MNGLRGLASVVVGYILMTVLVMFMTLGLVSFWPGAAEAADPPTAYVIINLLLSVFMAAVSSFATVHLAPEPKERWVGAYALVILITGTAYGASNIGGPQPTWYLFALPVLGALAIYLGGGWYIGRKVAAGGVQ